VNILRKIIKSIIFWIVSGEIILIILLSAIGFRITYAPTLETSWNAVGAVGQWVGGIATFLAVVVALNANWRQLTAMQAQTNEMRSQYVSDKKLELSNRILKVRDEAFILITKTKDPIKYPDAVREFNVNIYPFTNYLDSQTRHYIDELKKKCDRNIILEKLITQKRHRAESTSEECKEQKIISEWLEQQLIGGLHLRFSNYFDVCDQLKQIVSNSNTNH